MYPIEDNSLKTLTWERQQAEKTHTLSSSTSLYRLYNTHPAGPVSINFDSRLCSFHQYQLIINLELTV
jgi:hypothetical protein